MRIELKLFGAYRDFEPAPQIVLEVGEDASVADLRRALLDFGGAHWPGFRPGLLACSAFASDTEVLRDDAALPADGRMAVLPPVSGG